MRCVSRSNYVCTYYPELVDMRSADCCTRMCQRKMGRSTVRRKPRSGRSSKLGGLHRERASWDLVRMSCEDSGTRWHR